MQEREHTQAEVSRWLSGNHNFTLATLAKISVALGVNLITVQLIADIKALRLRISHKVASRKSRLDVELRILDKLLALGKMWLPQLSDAYKFQKNSLIIKYFCRLVMVMSKIMFTFVFRTR